MSVQKLEVLKAEEFKTKVAEAFDTTKKEAGEIIKTFTDLVGEVVLEEQKGVRFGDVGTFRPQITPEREHNNPQNGEKITKPAHHALKFQVNRGFKEELEQVDVK